MYIIHVPRQIRLRPDYVVPVSMLPNAAVVVAPLFGLGSCRAGPSSNPPLKLKREREFDSLDNGREVTGGTVYDDMKVIGENDPRDHFETRFTLGCSHGAAEQVDVFYEQRSSPMGYRCDKAILPRLEVSEEF